MKKLVLHIGMAKTGTSSIQESLGNGAEALCERQVYYPPWLPFNHSFTFPVLFKENAENTFHYKQLSPISNEDWEAELERLRRKWIGFFQSFESGVGIISAEALPGLSVEEIEKLKHFVEPYFDEVIAIAYVRDPVDSIRSRWEQDVKELVDPIGGEELLRETKRRHRYRFLQRWSEVLGEAQLIVRPLKFESLIDNSLLADFFHFAQLGNVITTSVQEKESNKSLGPEGVAFLLAFNRRHPQYVEGIPNRGRGLATRMHLLYRSMRKIRSEPLSLDIKFTANEADQFNQQIRLLNGFLEEQHQFGEVLPSEEATLLPDPGALDADYYLDLMNELALEMDAQAASNAHLRAESSLQAERKGDGAETMPFKRVILHIGLGKTGSSTIQQFLLANADALEKRGVYYPRKFPDELHFDGNHSQSLRAIFEEKPELIPANILAGRDTTESALAYGEGLKSAYMEGFGRSESGTLLLSAEGVAHLKRETVKSLATWLKTLAPTVKVVACIRHPRSALVSEIQQRLKVGATLGELFEDPPYYNFEQLLKKIGLFYGANNITTYDFQDAASHQGGITAAFLEKIGVSGEGLEYIQAEKNPSMSQKSALMLSSFNRQYPLFINGQKNPVRAPGDNKLFVDFPGAKLTIPTSVYESLAQRVDPQLHWLESTHALELKCRESEADNSGYGFLFRRWIDFQVYCRFNYQRFCRRFGGTK
ncbi:MAG: hypothetical protein ABJL54_08665 [Halioglobus sp.]